MKRLLHIVFLFMLSTSLSLSAQTYKIGDLIINDDGSRGIVFYVNTDRTDGWMVALNDLPTNNWGLADDLVGIPNLSEPMELFYETDGYANTGIIRQYHSGQGYTQDYGAGIVDYEHFWYIPTAGQLMKLCSAWSTIENHIIQAGGTTMRWQPYYSSSESTTSGQLWAVDFGSHLRDAGGNFINKDKAGTAYLRAVRNILQPLPPPDPTLPDNILESSCNTPLPSFEWGIREDWSSSANIYCRINPLVGDLDDDGIPEIVCFDMEGNSSSQTAAKTINVYDGQSKVLKTQISVNSLVWAHGNGPYGLVKLPNRKGLIVTACKDTKLYAYDITAANPSTPVWVSNESYNTGNNDFSVSLGFADFNGDGHPEIYVRNKIFNAETGVLLATAQGGNNQADSYSHNSHTNHNKLSCPLAFDICDDTRQELILGNEIYDVVITNPNGITGNHITLKKSITPPNGIINDGHVQVADFNLDGHPDILVSNRDTEGSTGTVSIYVWDVFNNQAYDPINLSTTFTGKSIPLIADFDEDGTLEILIDCCHESNQGLRAYHFNPNSNSFQYLWSLFIDEDSYSNTATLFDFNNDGNNELLFTDNSHFRIYDVGGTQPVQMADIDCGEISIMHIPLVVDVDNDNSAEIVVTGKAGGAVQANTMLKVYKSATEPWRAARPVWNQYMYHVTNVNEDLTIPHFCFNTSTVFAGSDGVLRRPYNNFLQQAGYITPDGMVYNPNGITNINIQGSACSSFTFNGIEYTESGLFEQLIESPEGCDTVYHIQVDLGSPVTFQFWRTRCDHFTWNDSTYYDSGDYQQTFTSIEGCDSIVTLHLTITETIYNEWSYQTCDDFVWNGTTYTEPGDYIQELITPQGCDSIVTLHLVIADTLTYDWSAQSCTDYTWNGTTYSQSGDYPMAFVTDHGCDSVSTLHLVIYEPYQVDIDTTACGSLSWNGQELTASGFYQATFEDANGCDSLVRLQLTIDPLPEAIPEIIGPTEVYVSSDLIFGLFNYSIDSVPYATHYQWSLGNPDWVMDTTGLQCQILIYHPGTATLRVKAWNGCGFSEQEIVIHAGFFDINDFQTISSALYPNPAHDKVTIEAESIVRIKLYNMQGQCVWEHPVNQIDHMELSLPSLPPSLYLVEIQTVYGIARTKLKTEPQ